MQVRYTRLFTDQGGASRFENKESQLQLGFAAPPAEPLYLGPLTPAVEAFWMGAPATWKGDKPHPAPRRMVFVTVQGEYQIEASGETAPRKQQRQQRAGEARAHDVDVRARGQPHPPACSVFVPQLKMYCWPVGSYRNVTPASAAI